MDKNIIKDVYFKRCQLALTVLKANGFKAIYTDNSKEALDQVISLIPKEAKVGIGGSATVKELGLVEALKKQGNTIIAHWDKCLDIKENAKILEIGTGSGYQSAILACLASEVYSVERIASLAKTAKATLIGCGYANVKVVVRDGTLGWKEYAPYDGIMVTAAAPKIPEEYIKQLKIGGRLVIPVGGAYSQVLTVVEKKSDGIVSTEVCGCVFVPLLGEKGWKE